MTKPKPQKKSRTTNSNNNNISSARSSNNTSIISSTSNMYNSRVLNTVADNKPISVWKLKTFPSRTKRYKVTPRKIKNLIEVYGDTTKSIANLLIERKIRSGTFFELIGTYPEIRTEYESARARKCHQHGSAALDLYIDTDIPDICCEYGDDGKKRLTSAGANYLKNKAMIYMRHAEISEAGTYRQRAAIDARTINVSDNRQVVNQDIHIDNLDADGLLKLIDAVGSEQLSG